MNDKDILLSFSLEEVCNDLLSNCNLISKNMLDEALADIRADVQSPDSDETKSLICRAVTEGWGKVKYQCQRYLTIGRSVDNNTLERLASYGPVELYWKSLDNTVDRQNAYLGFTSTDVVKVEHDTPTARISCAIGKNIIIAVPAETSFDVYDGTGKALVLNGECQVASVLLYTGSFRVDGVYFDEYRFVGGQTFVKVTFDDYAFKQQYEVLKLHLRIPNYNMGVTDALKSSIHKFLTDYVTFRFLKDLNPDKAAAYAEDCGKDQDSITKCLNARERIYRRRTSWL